MLEILTGEASEVYKKKNMRQKNQKQLINMQN